MKKWIIIGMVAIIVFGGALVFFLSGKSASIVKGKNKSETFGHLWGVVKDESGFPVSGAKLSYGIELCGFATDPDSTTLTNDNGIFDFKIKNPQEQNRTFFLLIVKDGFCSISAESIVVRDNEKTQMDFVLRKGGRLLIKINDSISGKPVVEAHVAVDTRDKLGEGLKSRGAIQSDENGIADFQALPPATFRIFASHPEYYQEYEFGCSTVLLGKIQEVSISLTKGAKIAGKVTDNEGNPIRDIRVNIEKYEGKRIIWCSSSAYTKYDGTYLMVGVPCGKFLIKASDGWGYNSCERQETVISSEQEFDNRDFVLTKVKSYGSVSGRILDKSGRPIKGASVNTNYGWCTTKENGEFKIDNMYSKTASLSASADGKYSRHLDVICAGDNTVKIVLEDLPILKGSVCGDEKFRFFWVALFDENPVNNLNCDAKCISFGDINESAEFEGFAHVPDGKYWIAAGISEGRSVFTPGPAIEIEIKPGKVIENLELEVGPKIKTDLWSNVKY